MRALFLMFLIGNFCLAAIATPQTPQRPNVPENRDYSDTLTALLSEPEADLIWSKLVIDNLVDPNVSIGESEVYISEIARQATLLTGSATTDQAKVAALRTVIYESGDWNSNRPFSYDFENPNGRLAKNKTILEYVNTRRGNCVNMPILFLLVGDKMGLKINLTTAPRHAFVQFEDRDRDELIHLEPTSGALPQRIMWQRKVLPMTDQAIETGMYMQRLNDRQQIAAMAETLLQALVEQNNPEERLEVAAIMLSVFPEFDIALLHTQDAHQKIIVRDFQARYPTPDLIPPELQAEFVSHARGRDQALTRLYELGWQPARDTPETFVPD